MKAIKPATLRCFDNGGRTFDRYTILPPRWAGADWRERDGTWIAFGASEDPTHPQGFGQQTSATPGRHLGRRVPFDSLPLDVRRCAARMFAPRPEVLRALADLVFDLDAIGFADPGAEVDGCEVVNLIADRLPLLRAVLRADGGAT